MARTKLIPKSKVTSKQEEYEGIDSLAVKQKLNGNRTLDLLFEAQSAWMSLARFRAEREKNKRYVYGDQWSDEIIVDDRPMTEEAYIKSQGNVPLKNNIMRKLVRTALGLYRSQSKEPTCVARDRDEQQEGETMSTVLQYNMQLNKMKTLHARTLEEFLISGLAVHRKWYGWRNDKLDCWTDNIQPNNFFIDANMRDLRGWDVNLIGEIHDISFEALCSRFAKDAEDFKKLQSIYGYTHNAEIMQRAYLQFGYDKPVSDTSFLLSSDISRCRVFEIWRKEIKPRYRCHDVNNGRLYKIDIEDLGSVIEENNRRMQQGTEAGMAADDISLIKYEWFIDEYWYYYFLSPLGDVLEEGETPYEHHSHPYVFCAYPFIDGEIHSFASDFRDQQRYINRLITMHDWIMRASAKGVLLFPEDCLPSHTKMSDIADEWARFNGVIMIKKGAQNLPQQIANNSTNIGISELLTLQLKLIEDISGVSGPLQGKPGFSGMSASLYSQQTQNATTSLLDLMETYSSFVLDGAQKDVKNIQQFYDEKRVFNIAGSSGRVVSYDPEKISDIEFDLSVIESTNTPVYKAISNDMLMEFWKAGAITLQQMLEVGSFPFADELLQSINSQQEQIEQGQTPDGISPQLMQQVQQNANMDNVNKAYEMMQG